MRKGLAVGPVRAVGTSETGLQTGCKKRWGQGIGSVWGSIGLRYHGKAGSSAHFGLGGDLRAIPPVNTRVWGHLSIRCIPRGVLLQGGAVA